ncbi:ribonuclease HII [Gayadomonas joobiniege]|uniref:ribonuclease HII n=1 Tax=Gayadomonas joobiniege TaxID=1234606 RepID=UPI000374ED65|nr:ribonuclease HII [Gayadomonas joobiniege]
MQTEFDINQLDAKLLVAGVDEVGRGPLVGSVVAAAVVLNPTHPIVGLKDSKKLSFKKRSELETLIKTHALGWAVASASPAEIDELNILHASMLAMQRAVEALTIPFDIALVDGNRLPKLACPAQPVVKGDDKVAAISAASILAKQARDREMLALAEKYPAYGFERHKGYPTKEHLALLAELTILPEYRKTFKPIRLLMAEADK